MSVVFPINRVASRQDSLNEIVSIVEGPEGSPVEEFEAPLLLELLPQPLRRTKAKQDINKRVTISLD